MAPPKPKAKKKDRSGEREKGQYLPMQKLTYSNDSHFIVWQTLMKANCAPQRLA
jgi:hypothetical protein